MRGARTAAGIGVALALTAGPLRADVSEAREHGVWVGARTGFGFSAGALSHGEALSSNFVGMIPIWMDAGYRLSQPLFVGAYFQWAKVTVSDDVCPPRTGLSCSAQDVRFGLQAHWHFRRSSATSEGADRFDPRVGLGTGYEIASIDLETPFGARSSEKNHGFEYVNVQVGGDWARGPWHVGAFFVGTVAEYLRQSQTVPTGSRSFSIPEPAVHLWLVFGVRWQYDW